MRLQAKLALGKVDIGLALQRFVGRQCLLSQCQLLVYSCADRLPQRPAPPAASSANDRIVNPNRVENLIERAGSQFIKRISLLSNRKGISRLGVPRATTSKNG
jgi:hypothetical protein